MTGPAPISVDTGQLRRVGGELSAGARATLLPAWDRLSRVEVAADPHAAEAPAADAGGALRSFVGTVAEEIRLAMLEMQRIGDDLVKAAQAYEETEREATRQNHELAAQPRQHVPMSEPARWKL